MSKKDIKKEPPLIPSGSNPEEDAKLQEWADEVEEFNRIREERQKKRPQALELMSSYVTEFLDFCVFGGGKYYVSHLTNYEKNGLTTAFGIEPSNIRAGTNVAVTYGLAKEIKEGDETVYELTEKGWDAHRVGGFKEFLEINKSKEELDMKIKSISISSWKKDKMLLAIFTANMVIALCSLILSFMAFYDRNNAINSDKSRNSIYQNPNVNALEAPGDSQFDQTSVDSSELLSTDTLRHPTSKESFLSDSLETIKSTITLAETDTVSAKKDSIK